MTTQSISFSSPTRILYIRHGEVPGNDPDPKNYIYTGCGTNDSLTLKGRLQADACAQKIAHLSKQGVFGKIAAIYSSPLQRAVETAEPLAQAFGLPVQQKAELQEISWGDADGQLVSKMSDKYDRVEKIVYQKYPGLENRKIRWDKLPVFPGAETYNTLLKRSSDALALIARKHPAQTILVVGHGRVLKTLIAEALNKETGIPYPENCGIAEFHYTDKGLRFIGLVQDPQIRSKL